MYVTSYEQHHRHTGSLCVSKQWYVGMYLSTYTHVIETIQIIFALHSIYESVSICPFTRMDFLESFNCNFEKLQVWSPFVELARFGCLRMAGRGHERGQKKILLCPRDGAARVCHPQNQFNSYFTLVLQIVGPDGLRFFIEFT
jgi:hypothetical protein